MSPVFVLGRRPDVILAVVVAGLVAMLIVPLSSLLLDGLIALNIAAAVLVLMSALFARNALELSTFPTLLLLTTLFRLGLNVSTTRGILARAEAGEVVQAFGAFVLQGDVVTGFVIFLVITLVQFLVIGKGAERVAEVGARFTLDALPGKQMSIDAGLRAGALTEAEAQEQRDELGRLSTLFGNMDGAMKFVKGDAIAGLVITTLNLAAGMVIGVMRNDMSAGEAADVYTVLTIGDGLVSQIPALLITLSAGVVVTRVEAKEKDKDLGYNLKEELFTNPKALNLAAGLILLFSLVPGLPTLPFLVTALGLFAAGTGAPFVRGRFALPPEPAASFEAEIQEKLEAAKREEADVGRHPPSVVPIKVELGEELSALLGFSKDGRRHGETRLMSELLPQLRDTLFQETGVRFPGVRIQTHERQLPAMGLAIRLHEVLTAEVELTRGSILATCHPSDLDRLAVEAQPLPHPIHGGTVALVPARHKDMLQSCGVHTWDAAGMVALHLLAVLRRRAQDFVGLQEVSEQLEELERAYPVLVREVVPKAVSLGQVVSVLQRLVDERVSIRDMKTILEALAKHGGGALDELALYERVRSGLGYRLAERYARPGGSLPVILVDPLIEETIESSIYWSDAGPSLAIEPEIAGSICQSVMSALGPALELGTHPVVIVNPNIRRYLRKLIELDLPEIAVFSFSELPPELDVQPVGRATIQDPAGLAA